MFVLSFKKASDVTLATNKLHVTLR